jgi:hypothetical protein
MTMLPHSWLHNDWDTSLVLQLATDQPRVCRLTRDTQVSVAGDFPITVPECAYLQHNSVDAVRFYDVPTNAAKWTELKGRLWGVIPRPVHVSRFRARAA